MRMSLRLFLGGIAALLGVSATATELVAASAEPATTDHSAGLQPQSGYVPGTYSSCTAKFGLSKSNADLATFDVVAGTPPVSPLPVVGTDIIPLMTVSDGVTVETCELQLAWTDATTFTDNFVDAGVSNGHSYIAGTAIAYPGTNNYWLVPGLNIGLLIDGTTPFTATTRLLMFADSLPLGSGVSVSPQPVSIQTEWQPYGLQPSSAAALSTSFFQRVSAAVEDSGNVAQQTFLDTYLATYYGGVDPTPMCTADQATANALFATMDSLMNGWGGTWMLPTDCLNLSTNDLAVGQILQYAAQIAAPALTVTVTGLAPSTTTTSTTTPTDPVVPQFTG